MATRLPGAGALTTPQLIAVGAALVAVLSASLVTDDYLGPGWATPQSVVLVVAAAAAVVVSIRFPRSAVVATTVIMALGSLLGGAVFSYVVALLVTLFAAAFKTDRRTALLCGGGALLIAAPTAIIFLPGEWGDSRAIVQWVAYIGFAVAAGDAARSRKAVIDSLTERTRRAEETAEAGARRRVAEERVRIARDLHDVMAHQIAVINLQASVASNAVRSRPEDAERSLVTIREAARTVLGEIGGLLSVLRAGDAESSAAKTTPVPGLGLLDGLLDDVRRGGLRVDFREVGDRSPFSASSDVVAYRVIQEALTNAQKHGNDSSALLHLEWNNVGLEIIVINSVGPTSGHDERTPSGHGLIGVRERVLSVCGRAESTFGPGPVHRFTAWLPYGEFPPPPGAERPAATVRLTEGGT